MAGMGEPWDHKWAVQSLIDNVRAFIQMVDPDEMTPHAKRVLESILESHANRSSSEAPDQERPGTR